jgi:hypothetical protein
MLPTNKHNKGKTSSPNGPKGPKKTRTRTKKLSLESVIHGANKNTVEVTSLMSLVPGRVTPNVKKRTSSNRTGFKNLSALKKRSRSKKYSFEYRPGSVEYRRLSQQSSRTPSKEPLYAVLPPLSSNKINSIRIEKPPGVTKTKKGKTKKRKITIAPKIKELMKKFERRNESAK